MNCDNQFVCSCDLEPLDQARTDNQSHDIVQMKAVQNVNKVLCQEYNSLDGN